MTPPWIRRTQTIAAVVESFSPIGTTVSAAPEPNPAGGQADGQTALVGKPLNRVADAVA